MEREKLFTKDYLVNASISFLIMFMYYQIMAIIAVHAMDSMDASHSQAGLAAGVLIIAALLTRILTGKLIDQTGRKRLLYAGLGLNAAAMALYFTAPNLPVLIAVRLLHGTGFGLATTACLTIMVHSIPESRRGEGISYFMQSTTLASAAGPSLGIFLYGKAGFTFILIINCALVVLAFLASLMLQVQEAVVEEKEHVRLRTLTPASLFERRVLSLASIGFLVFMAYSSIMSFLSAYVRSTDLVEAGSIFFVVYSVTTLISRPFTSRTFDRKGADSVMYPAFICFAAGLILLSRSESSFMLLTAAVFLGLGFGTFVPSAQAIGVKQVESNRMSMATTTFLAISETGIGLGPFVLGFFIPVIGYKGVYFGLSFVSLAAMGLYSILYGSKRKR